MNPSAANQIALDNALVASEARLKIGECNRRIEFTKPQREATYQVTLDALKLSPCYPAFLITTGVPEIYMHQFWNTVTKVQDSSSYRFKLDNKKFRVNVEISHDILHICPKLPDQPFDIPPSTNEEIVKTTGLDNLRLSRAQIRWGMYHCKNVDFVELLWEDFAFQIDNHFSKLKFYGDVALRMFIKRIVIQSRVEDLQLGVESYQKKLNLTKSETFKPDLRNRTAYTTYPDPQRVIYEDQNNRNRLMRTDELHKFSNGTLNYVRTALHDITSGIRMEYLPKRKLSGLDKRRARVMIQDIDKHLFQRRLMRNLEKFVGGREYGEDLRLLGRTI
ncbi:hypothetical protein Tco_1006092 [Tanacetum coccineum]|uniref:Uncharacterized protein n=1 Tax=Tanacetum coccineum TaxID=301880 RepID=A0ABQ5FHN0_9ASTR